MEGVVNPKLLAAIKILGSKQRLAHSDSEACPRMRACYHDRKQVGIATTFLPLLLNHGMKGVGRHCAGPCCSWAMGRWGPKLSLSERVSSAQFTALLAKSSTCLFWNGALSWNLSACASSQSESEKIMVVISYINGIQVWILMWGTGIYTCLLPCNTC